jgi:AcrR family transcriptional regulator
VPARKRQRPDPDSARPDTGVQPTVRRDRGRPRGAVVVDRVLAATLSELARVGIDGLSVDQVATLASVNKTSVYRRWPTREALVAAALGRVLERTAAQFPDTGSLAGDLMALLTPLMQMISAPPGRALLRAGLSEHSTSAMAALAAEAIASPTTNPLHGMVERAQRRGEWRTGVRPDYLISMLVGAMIHRAMLEHAPLSTEWLAANLDIALYGVLPRA